MTVENVPVSPAGFKVERKNRVKNVLRNVREIPTPLASLALGALALMSAAAWHDGSLRRENVHIRIGQELPNPPDSVAYEAGLIKLHPQLFSERRVQDATEVLIQREKFDTALEKDVEYQLAGVEVIVGGIGVSLAAVGTLGTVVRGALDSDLYKHNRDQRKKNKTTP